MRYLSKILMTMVLLMACSLPVLAENAPSQAVDQAYVIGAGDVLFVSVWKDEALTKNVTVTPDGRISFPLVGEQQAAGLSIKELSAQLRQRLERYVPDAEINIAVQQVNSAAVYVLGEVNRPGRYPVVGPLTTLQALAMAGGLTPFAKENSIKIFHQDGVQKFKYCKVVSGKQPDAPIKSGDVIVVP